MVATYGAELLGLAKAHNCAFLFEASVGGGTPDVYKRQVQTAANEYFNKDVSQLTLWECASIASITKNPTNYNPYTCLLYTSTAQREPGQGPPEQAEHDGKNA